jgi:hypothetical protein
LTSLQFINKSLIWPVVDRTTQAEDSLIVRAGRHLVEPFLCDILGDPVSFRSPTWVI